MTSNNLTENLSIGKSGKKKSTLHIYLYTYTAHTPKWPIASLLHLEYSLSHLEHI
jgi:hypothetical protein